MDRVPCAGPWAGPGNPGFGDKDLVPAPRELAAPPAPQVGFREHAVGLPLLSCSDGWDVTVRTETRRTEWVGAEGGLPVAETHFLGR